MDFEASLAWIVTALIVLFAHVVRETVEDELRGMPKRDRWLLFAVVLLGAAIRYVASPRQLMGVTDYSRGVPWIWWMIESRSPLIYLFPDGMDRFELASALNLGFSFLMPVLMYVQARLAFRGDVVPLASALLFAVCPLPVYFAASNVEFISSMFFSALTLVMAHRMLAAETLRRMVLPTIGFVLACALTVDARPENVCLGFVVPFAFAMATDFRPRLRWHWLVPGLALGITAFFLARLLLYGVATPAPSTGVPGSALMLLDGLEKLPRALIHQNYFHPDRMPLVFTLLALLGLVKLWRQDRRRLAYLLVWFGSIYGVHGLIMVPELIMISRYALHTIVPVLFLGAHGVDALVTWVGDRESFAGARRTVLYGGVVALVVVGIATFPRGLTLFHQKLDDRQQEYRFLRAMIDEGLFQQSDVIVEKYRPDSPESGRDVRARFASFGVAVRSRWMLTRYYSKTRVEPADARVFLYLGLPCFWDRDAGAPISKVCSDLLASADWELLRSQPIDGERHDMASGPRDAKGGTIALYRLKTPPPVAAP